MRNSISSQALSLKRLYVPWSRPLRVNANAILYLREARSRFNKAISLENSERLALSYIGLALCHFRLGDDDNGREALRAVNLIEFDGVAEKIIGRTGKARTTVKVAKFVLSFVAVFANDYGASRRKKLRELQHSVQRFLETES